MKKYLVKVSFLDDNWYWSGDDWKYEVCVDFDEHVVILEDRDNRGITEASWWGDAVSLVDNLDYYESEEDFISDNAHEYAEDKLHDVWALYQKGDYYTDDTEFIVAVAEILDPSLKLEYTTISSYNGSADVVYEPDFVDVGVLSDWYFGEVREISLYELDEDALAEALENGDVDIETDYRNGLIKIDYDDSAVRDCYEPSDEGTTCISDTEYYKIPDKEAEFASWFGIPASDIEVYEG